MMLRDVPIVEQDLPAPTEAQLACVDRLADVIRREYPELAKDAKYYDHVVKTLDDGHSLHLDDLSQIPFLDAGRSVRCMQDRARLRAGEGDLVASCSSPVPGFEEYAREQLGLGSVEWLHPRSFSNPLRIAEACWEDRQTRRSLVHRLREGSLTYLHPNMGTLAVWELAKLLQDASRRPMHVIAPTPALCRWVNDKVIFARTAGRLLGPRLVPTTASAWNLSMLAKHVSEIAESARCIGLKLPDSAGGDSNILVNTAQVRGRPLKGVSQMLAEATAHIGWNGESHLLIDQWETDVVSSPSVQTWIPPAADGPPIIEGVFSQIVEQPRGIFVGTAAANLPDDLAEQLVTNCWLLALLYQRLGYVGRCSFDAILVGTSMDLCRIELIECNGRWGGTSSPMTLMNRIFGDWMQRPFAVRTHSVPGLSRMTFAELRDVWSPHLYDRRTGNGWLITYNPARLAMRSGITTLAFAQSLEEAMRRLDLDLPRLLQEVVHSQDGKIESSANRVGKEH